MAPRDLQQLRDWMGRLAGVSVVEVGGMFQYRSRGRTFGRDHGPESVLLKAPTGVQAALLSRRPDRYFVPPYVGSQGWVGVHTADMADDWTEVESLVMACVDQAVGAVGRKGEGRYPWALAGGTPRASENSPHLPSDGREPATGGCPT